MKEVHLSKPYSFGPYNKCSETEQWIRLSEGCPNQCPYCAEPSEYKIFPIPKIVRKNVKILDMNILAKPQFEEIINKLPIKRGPWQITYELICGIDYRFLTIERAKLLQSHNFINIRLAWDSGINNQMKIKDAIKMLKLARYDPKTIMIFMICNWKIPYKECMQKLDLLKVWNVKVADCYFDNQTSPNIKSIYWKPSEIEDFRRKCRKHNQIVRFGIDPEIKEFPKDQKVLL